MQPRAGVHTARVLIYFTPPNESSDEGPLDDWAMVGMENPRALVKGEPLERWSVGQLIWSVSLHLRTPQSFLTNLKLHTMERPAGIRLHKPALHDVDEVV